jgi:hypothetical protein
MGKRVAILQSNYIPWKGYFDIIKQVDEFILYDDVQYTKRDWRNRNRIKTAQGPLWLSVPVHASGRSSLIHEATIEDGQWAQKHLQSFLHHYKKAPAFEAVYPALQELYAKAADLRRLIDVNRLFLDWICGYLGIPTVLSSSLDYQGHGTKTERLLSLCLQAGATLYLSGPAAKDYLDESQFTAHGIAVAWMSYAGYPEYPQLYPPFDHAVTALDLILNTGEAAATYLERHPAGT